MGNELRYVCHVETRRLLLFMGAVFGLVLFVQYLEFPYVSVLSSVFETSKSRVETIENVSNKDWLSRNAPTAMEKIDGMRYVKDEFVVESGKSPVVDLGNDFGMENGKASNNTFGDDFILESGKTLNETFGDDFDLENGKDLNVNGTLDDGFDAEDEIPLKDSLEMDRDSTIDTAVRKDVEDTDDGLQEPEETSRTNASLKDDGIENVVETSERNKEKFPMGKLLQSLNHIIQNRVEVLPHKRLLQMQLR